ncbi:U3 snoRNP-associated protein Imp4 [Schizosaccharomyces cryophilus OY26]|uniref:U3 small nucleolar ribonucleoprotein protein IMP4 n=1 Tax=Schizosaccharomyces cryophilus (strain OY26 / ATCC MYA-4695 / CBS 11777 / NBRC 106824 / NRRL Y48691) TaxID=653667 RepID=S9W336_SCHCR|nr:U3 snoRNP-associated protein Imp4 [Schizosaccharomyces cryophilus OY26]EPY52360.1 U3 snoRNP-associated protein Imp4 [Schizosaccharomyces cryophilus OY26]
MLRRAARERRQFIYKRNKDLQEAKLNEKRRALRHAIDNNKELNKDLQEDTQLQKDYKYDESKAAQEDELGIDDEYYSLGEREPRVLVTTSRDPSSRLAQFAKEMRLLIPNSFRLNRGNIVVGSLVEAARANDITDIVLLHEHRGIPDSMVISHLPYGPTVSFSLHNVVLRHDIPNTGTMSEAYPHLILDNLTSKLGQRVKKVLSSLFPPDPKESSPRVVTFANSDDFISFRHHLYAKTGPKQVILSEAGPRFEMRLYEIRLGTLDMLDADVEWRLKPYQRHKRQVLAE